MHKLIRDTDVSCLAWALMPNHFHLLLKTTETPISSFMRRLLTGHALWFNKRHDRSGHLFQNRFKSVLCQEDIYFLELVRYIHLNPFRAKLVKDFEQLSRYKYCGHAALLGNISVPWQATFPVLAHFGLGDKMGNKVGRARRNYLRFVEKGIDQGKRSDLTGGGLIRSSGGWTAIKALRQAKLFQKSDERILGDSDFVETALKTADESLDKRYKLIANGYTLESLAEMAANIMGVDPQMVWIPGKYRATVEARSILCYWAVRELGFSMSSLARKCRLSITTVSKSVVRGKKIVQDRNLTLNNHFT